MNLFEKAFLTLAYPFVALWDLLVHTVGDAIDIDLDDLGDDQ